MWGCWHPSWYCLHRIVQRVALVRVLVRVGFSVHSLWSSGTGGFFYSFLLSGAAPAGRGGGGGHCGASLWAPRWESQSELRGRPSVVVGSAELLRSCRTLHISTCQIVLETNTHNQTKKQRAKAAAVKPRLTSAVGEDVSVRPQHFSRYSLSPKTCREQISFN